MRQEYFRIFLGIFISAFSIPSFASQVVMKEPTLSHIPYMVSASTHIVIGNVVDEVDTCYRASSIWTHCYTRKNVLIEERVFGEREISNPLIISFGSGGMEDSVEVGKSYTFFLSCDSTKCFPINFKKYYMGKTHLESILFDTSSLNCKTEVAAYGYPHRGILAEAQRKLIPVHSKDLNLIAKFISMHYETSFKWAAGVNSIGFTAFYRKNTPIAKPVKYQEIFAIAEKMVRISEKEFDAARISWEKGGQHQGDDCKEFE